ncbi:GntR family transcriptional regulator [Acidisoma cellulosilytica]|uniref:GntR family transcriptional regulator n=1 Tax=Acidisoma cellulosilyticum TaxID=2802395 RepID=A0A963Z3A5_9PROT|nr:GntR family transcriptional regulator [Acidisoma cellulosilyticum]MCB8882067.1 GntR family transcriptional regulator [Acidisoma cellulosilyticum]
MLKVLANDFEDADATAAHRIFEQLSEAIVSGDLAAGSKIQEAALAARFGVSRAPLREALRRLEERKLLTRSPRSSARVTVLTPARIVELFTIREVLEGVAARQAASHMNASDINHLRALLQRHEEVLDAIDDDIYRQGIADEDFHFYIIKCSGNATLAQILCNEYYNLIRLVRRQHSRVPGRARRALSEHHQLIEALAEGDGNFAEILMRRHVASALRSILGSIATQVEIAS